ncbi:MAG: helix-turn-helix transcriptional regulator [Ruminococcus sp.]|jgi:transcriptional regulator with XRE-family HTH domain
MDLDLLAQNLRFFRKAYGYTQEQLAEVLNIQRQSYCNYENGRRTPSIEILADITELYGITLDMLIQPVNNNSDSGISDYTIVQLITDYRSLSESTQREIQHYISYLKNRDSEIHCEN